MILAYLDETGNTGTDLRDSAGQPIHWVGALLVSQQVWHASKAEVEGIQAFAKSAGFPEKECELHGAEILHGTKGWRTLSVANRLEVLTRAVLVMERYKLRLILGGCNKKLLQQRYVYPDHPHKIATWLCLERVARYVTAQGEAAILIADECSADMKKISRGALQDYRSDGAPFGPSVDLSCLLDTIHYMSSAASAHIQLCDIALFIRQRSEISKDARVEELYRRTNQLISGTGIIPY